MLHWPSRCCHPCTPLPIGLFTLLSPHLTTTLGDIEHLHFCIAVGCNCSHCSSFVIIWGEDNRITSTFDQMLRVLRPFASVVVAQRRWTHSANSMPVTPTNVEVDAIVKRIKDDEQFRLQLSTALAATSTELPQVPTIGVAEPLTGTQWAKLAVRTAIPFFGFGVCDNLIMISVGDFIDTEFGVTLGFSTMVAAGLGQAVSDGCGITIQGAIEALADKMGLPNPNLTEAQKTSKRVLFWQQVFRTLGIISGCLAGLAPVILFDTGNRPRLYDQLLGVLPEEQRRDLSARATYVTVKEGEHLFTFGKEADAVYTIVTGEVAVVGRSDSGESIEFCKSGPGANLGVIEMVFGHKCVADVVVSTPTVRLLKIGGDDFRRIAGGEAIRNLVTKYVEEDDTFVVYRARHMKGGHLDS